MSNKSFKIIAILACLAVESNISFLAYAAAIAGTAEIDTHWVAEGSSGTTFTFTYNNPGEADDIVNVKIKRPNKNFTTTGSSGNGWSAAVAGDKITFTGNAIAAQGNRTQS